ncbi:MAG TPA: hypothetical protein VGF67_19725 [Ktedonobacteraceae bacterium]
MQCIFLLGFPLTRANWMLAMSSIWCAPCILPVGNQPGDTAELVQGVYVTRKGAIVHPLLQTLEEEASR